MSDNKRHKRNGLSALAWKSLLQKNACLVVFLMEKALIIRGNLPDLSDVLRIARAEGKKLLNVEKVNVKPVVYPHPEGVVVLVSPEYNGDGCRKPLVVERKHGT